MIHDVYCIICDTALNQIDLPNDATQAEIDAATHVGCHGDNNLHGSEVEPCWKINATNMAAQSLADELAEAERLRELLGL